MKIFLLFVILTLCLFSTSCDLLNIPSQGDQDHTGTEDGNNDNGQTDNGTEEPRISFREDTILLVDGEPFFPIGIYWVYRDAIEELSSYGFNLVYGYPGEIDSIFDDEPASNRITLKSYLDACSTHDVYSIISLHEILESYETGVISFDKITSYIEPYKDHPAVLLYYLYDEPENELPADFVQPEFLEEVHEGLTQFDIPPLTAGTDLMWSRSNSEIPLGMYSAGDRIYFAVEGGATSSMDLTRVTFSIKREGG